MPHGSESPTNDGAWQASTWAPIVLVFLLMATGLLTGHLGTKPGTHSDTFWFYALIGAVFSQPILCAFWAGWAPNSILWRLPLGVTACVVLSLSISTLTAEEPWIAPIMFSVMFLVFYCLFAVIRWIGHWRLSLLSNENDQPIEDRAQFNIRYLFIWTSVVAVLLALGRFIAFDGQSNMPTNVVGILLQMIGVFSLMLMPMLIGGMIT